jgi:hypothetical protein
MRKYAVWLLLLAFIVSLPFAFAQEKPYTFIAIGDTGCDCSGQEKVARRLVEWHRANPFETVLMLGDNIYGSSMGRGGDRTLFDDRFDEYYSPLLAAGVKFYATLGNHDTETRRGIDLIADKKRFNILGSGGYYSFYSDAKVDGKPLVHFISLNSVSLIKKDASDRAQIEWLSKTLIQNGAIWKVVYLHHPLYAPDGEGHEPEVELRRNLEDVFVAAGVQLVLSGHNHYYARMKTQRGITHFISGGGGRSLKTPIVNQYTVRAAEIYHFVSFEVYPDKMEFTVVPAESKFTDSGSIYPEPPGGDPVPAAVK